MELAVLTESQCHTVCHQCTRHRWASSHQMVCDEDGRDIIEHARERACPLGRYVAENVPATPPASARDECPKWREPTPWPMAVRIIASRRREGEAGVGDTLKRLVGPIGVTFERAFEWLVGRSCGCGDRRQRLNLMYPYAGEDRAGGDGGSTGI